MRAFPPQRGHTTFAAAPRLNQSQSRRCCFSATTLPRSLHMPGPTAGATHWRQSPLKNPAVEPSRGDTPAVRAFPSQLGTHHFCRCPSLEPASKPAMLLFRNNTSSFTPNARTNLWGHPLTAVAFEEPICGDTPVMPTRPRRKSVGTHLPCGRFVPTGTHQFHRSPISPLAMARTSLKAGDVAFSQQHFLVHSICHDQPLGPPTAGSHH